MSAVPRTVLGLARVPLDLSGAAAWGRPAVTARCGLPAPGPSVAPCLAVDGVDWLLDLQHADVRFLTFGRSPALEVVVPHRYPRTSATSALVDLAPVARALPRTGSGCQGTDPT